MKICSKCGIEKPLNEYPNNSKCKDGKIGYCKKCHSLQQRQGYLRNREKKLNYQKEYAKRNDDKIRDYRKKYREENNEKLNNISKTYYENNKEKARKNNMNYYEKNKIYLLNYQKEYSENNKRKINQRSIDRRNNDPDFRIKQYAKAAFNQSFKRQMAVKKKRFFSYTEIHIDKYINHLKKDNMWDKYCGNNNMEIDHIIPISVYDFNNPEDIKKCWNPLNLRIISAKENSKKKAQVDYSLIKKHGIKNLLPERLKDAI